GLPNAGKSTFISQVSAARPKIANYPFTTLYPSLGVVTPVPHKSFVIADIPGLIEGASQGLGLGIQFLKHLSRTRLLLHLVDIHPDNPEENAVDSIETLAHELAEFSQELADKPRWLVINKLDLIPEEAHESAILEITNALAWQAPVFGISSVSGLGTEALTQAIMLHLEQQNSESDG
ncbi:MAG TPA: GTPase ObgE, partial [Gammaproteobacteria bacterium]|nr:GTPase ObgE [Gammaproteobacteria bacterium]